MDSRTILVTGASGFVGSALSRQLHDLGVFIVRAPSRQEAPLAAATDWSAALAGVDTVIHSAARVHVMQETASDSLGEFRKVNVEGTLNLARQAAEAGVRRFIFISSIKVNGELSSPGQPLRADDAPAPQDAYGRSKLEAEQGLQQLAAATGLELVVIRPVLVYGPGVKANFRSMLGWVQRGIPLPLGALGNRRSLIFVDNLVDLVLTCIDHPLAANQVFLGSDGQDVTLSDLLRALGRALGRPARLLPVPPALLRALARLLGRGDMAQRLLGWLQVDIEKNHRLLGWTPPHTLEQGLKLTARDFLDNPHR
ncbi:UDP-glucose 4-epimerase family protein [Pseudomonas promysalinigenes]|uniref:UDP-glucose 4-epimerase family protein n=1 Tax=Pseudomonas promysalinigenes TaxID=485898 RepID=UPI001645DCBC|nr:SDR family oxidoreductase [Pseudomonas promysalinigenes]QXI34984.1 SDR family oxidoreductase [Pseudomonas promysalinigenes]